jgi:hypothetical protein
MANRWVLNSAAGDKLLGQRHPDPAAWRRAVPREGFQRIDNLDLLSYNCPQLAVEQAVLWVYVMIFYLCGDDQSSKPW